MDFVCFLVAQTRAVAVKVVAAPLVTLHVAPDAEGLAAAGVGALEGLLAGVGVAVDPEGAGPREGLVAGLADVPVLRLREGGGRGGRDVVVVLPRVRSARGSESHRDREGREGLGQRALVVEPGDLLLRRRRRLHRGVVRRHRRLRHVGRCRSKRRGPIGWLYGDTGDGGRCHVLAVSLGVDVAQRRRRLEVVVGGDRELADGLC